MKARPLAPEQRPARSNAADEVVLLDDTGRPIGHADRLLVHSTETPLHLAFSTYIFNSRGEVLLTRRALAKKTWPGVWTNSCCGHPKPGEPIEDAVHRRVREELGIHVGPLVPLLPDFRYRAIDASGIVENEVCPVFGAFVTDQDPSPDTAEVAEWAWVPWASLADAVRATPQVYSPWAALQVPQIAPHIPVSIRRAARPVVDVAAAVRDVDALLTAEIAALADEWDGFVDGMGVDVLPEDLPRWLEDLLVGRGKRVRVAMAYWGFVAAGGVHGSPAYQSLLRAAAAVETLHLFALVHDDVMDESESRRGRPAAHVEASGAHLAAHALGDAALFGRNLAILLGDLAHTCADRLAAELPAEMRRAWFSTSIELIAGQRADLTGAAAGRSDREHAEQVARLKSGRYTVVRPLQLGGLAAGATAEELASLVECGEHIGRAFALRDDYLGVWGDPELTGKPAGDDLLTAKATLLLDITRERLTGPARDLLTRIGTPTFGRADVEALTTAMHEAGVDAEVERMITEAVDAATACLESGPLAPDGVDGIRDAARTIAWRQS